MRKYEDSVSSAVTGLPVYLAEISVQNADTTPAQLYSDNGVTPLTQPALTDGLGLFSFYVADGAYTLIVADPGGANPRTFTNVEIYEDARNVSVPIGEAGLVLPSAGARAGLVLGFDGSGQPVATPLLPGPAGAPGGNILAVGLWTEVVAGMDLSAVIASGARRFCTSGYASTKYGAASYRILASVADAAEYSELSATGVGHYSRHGQNIWWCQLDATHRAVLSTDWPRAEMFGAVPDATYDYASDLWSGTDNQPAIQAMLDYGTYCGGGAVYLSSGAYLIGKSLHAGYGDQFVGTKLYGQGVAYAGQAFAGTAIVHNFSQGMAINYQGQRHGYCLGIEFVGPNVKYLSVNGHCGVGTPAVDDTNPANWINPALWVGAGNTHSPLAAVTLDAYSGAQPAGTDPLTGLTYTRYPDVAYPAASGIVGQFNRALSSVLHLEGGSQGYAVGVCIQPGDSDGNGDFVQINSWSTEYTQYAISVGQTQSRSVRIDYLSMGIVYCAMTSNRHGRRNGQFGGELRHFTASGIIRVMEIGSTSIVGSLRFGNCYIEAGWQLGTCNGASSVEVPISFSNIKASFSLQDLGGRGVPAFMWGHPTSAAGTTVPLTFRDGELGDMPYVADFRGVNVRMDNVSIRPVHTGTTAGIAVIPRFMAFAHNATMGWSCPSFRSRGQDHRIYSQPRNLTDGTLAGGGTSRLTDGNSTMGYRDVGTPFWMSAVQPQSETDADPVRHPQRTGTLAPSGLTLTSDLTTLTDDDAPIRLRLEGTMPTLAGDPSIRWGGVAGTILRETATGTLFAVYSYNGATGAFKARILSNYKLVSGTYQLYDSTGWVTATSQFSPYYAGWSTPIRPLYADFASGSAAVTNLQRLDGSAATAAEIVNGDSIVVNLDRDSHLLSANATITALNLGAKTLSLSGSGAAASATTQRITGLLRQPPANL